MEKNVGGRTLGAPWPREMVGVRLGAEWGQGGIGTHKGRHPDGEEEEHMPVMPALGRVK